MIVFDLRCANGHVFEAWFASSGTFDVQAAAGQVRCPVCDDGAVEKAVMAPAVATKGNRQGEPMPPAAMKAVIERLAHAQAKVLANSRWVGTAFASEARAMHEGERDAAVIHGQASLAEAKALVEDGVPIAPLPFPVVPPESLN